ncbi:MAG: DUF72 domain-containing protein [bacterium]
MNRKGSIHIGTSGWHYQHWKGSFYPREMRSRDFLEYYADRFRTVEINNTFYQIPDTETLKIWSTTVPEGFIFAVKASRFITHIKRLKDPKEPVSTFLDRVEALGSTLGPVLFQLPPRWRSNLERLDAFLDTLPVNHRYAFEFRDPRWFNEGVYHALEKRNAAFCIFDLNGSISPKEITADFVYIRLHGPGGPYEGSYKTEELAGWAGALSTWSKGGRTVYCYFDNDQAGYAARNALRLQSMIQGG